MNLPLILAEAYYNRKGAVLRVLMPQRALMADSSKLDRSNVIKTPHLYYVPHHKTTNSQKITAPLRTTGRIPIVVWMTLRTLVTMLLILLRLLLNLLLLVSSHLTYGHVSI